MGVLHASTLLLEVVLVMMSPILILAAVVGVVLRGIHKTGGHEDGNGHTEDPQEDVHADLQCGGLVVLLNLALIGSLILGLVTGTLAVAFFIFEVGLVATLQAFIFTILAAIYLGGAVAEEH